MTKDQLELEEKSNTRCRIIDAAIQLFGLKGFSATTTREICKFAHVNIASLNYHFKSKENLLQEVTAQIMCEFKTRVDEMSLDGVKNTEEFAEKVFRMFTEDGPKFLNHFKIFIESDNVDIPGEKVPPGHKNMLILLSNDLKATVPVEEKQWANSIIFAYVVHMALMVSSPSGRRAITPFYPRYEEDVVVNLKKLVGMIIRDLNGRY